MSSGTLPLTRQKQQRGAKLVVVPARGPISASRRGLLFTLLAALTILPSGFNLALPEIDTGSVWTMPLEIVHGVYIHHIIAMVWFVFALIAAAAGVLDCSVPTRVRVFAFLIALLGIAGLISTIANASSTWADYGESGRLFLLAFSFVLMWYWAKWHGQGFIMRWLLAGIALGGLVNIYYSVTRPYNAVGIVPFLYNRNGAGGILALGIVLGAYMWLICDHGSRTDRLAAAAASLVGIVGVGMSFSKTAMVVGASGLATWLLALRVLSWKIMRYRRAIRVLVACGVILAAIESGVLSRMMEDVKRSIETKFTGVLSPENNQSVRERLLYYAASAEILAANPLAGVGYSGFYENVIKTNTYNQKNSIQEDPSAGKRANPHNSFLYYVVANGAIGLGITVALFLLFIRAVFSSIPGSRLFAYAVAGCLASAFFLYANTLPSLFKTEVMYIPAAAAMATRLRKR